MEYNVPPIAPTPLAPTPKKSHKTLWIFGGLIILILVAGAGLRLYRIKNAPTCGGFAALSCPRGYECVGVANYPDASGYCVKSDKDLKQEDKTVTVNSDWKTYANEEYGFEFKYPATWNIVVENAGGLKDALPMTLTVNTGDYKIRVEADYHDFEYSQSHVGFTGQIIVDGRPINYVDSTDGKLYSLRGTDNRTFFVSITYPKNAEAAANSLIQRVIATFKFRGPIVGQNLPKTCVDEPEGKPVITSLSSYSGSMGMTLEIKGCNFAGFEGDKNAWIENSQGVKGLLWGEAGSTAKLLKVTLKSPLCQKDNSYTGWECDSYLNLTPGAYKIFISAWAQESNKVDFIIK